MKRFINRLLLSISKDSEAGEDKDWESVNLAQVSLRLTVLIKADSAVLSSHWLSLHSLFKPITDDLNIYYSDTAACALCTVELTVLWFNDDPTPTFLR